jgi:hypothetical protein
MKPALFLLALALLTPGETAASADERPLPELSAFLKNVRSNLRSNDIIQSQYTYTEKAIERQPDGKTESRTWEIYPTADPRLTYRKLIRINDETPSAEQVEKNERAYEKRRKEWERQQAKNDPDDIKRREEKEAEVKREEEKNLDEAFRLYQFTMTGREQLEGISAIVLMFEARPDYKPGTREGKILSKIHGKAWFSETDYELIRLEAELKDNISFGFGILAKINKGTRMAFQRRKINNEIWLPATSHVTGTGKLLIFKGFHIDQEAVYSDYQKFSVETSIEYSKPKPRSSEPETGSQRKENR